MENIKRIVFITAILGILLAPNFSSAITIAEIQAQLNIILQKIQQLQEQLAQYSAGYITPTPTPSPTPSPTSNLDQIPLVPTYEQQNKGGVYGSLISIGPNGAADGSDYKYLKIPLCSGNKQIVQIGLTDLWETSINEVVIKKNALPTKADLENVKKNKVEGLWYMRSAGFPNIPGISLTDKGYGKNPFSATGYLSGPTLNNCDILYLLVHNITPPGCFVSPGSAGRCNSISIWYSLYTCNDNQCSSATVITTPDQKCLSCGSTPPPSSNPPSCTISFTPSSIGPGQSTTVKWSSQNDADNLLDYSCTKTTTGSIIGSGQGAIGASGSLAYLYNDISQYLPATCTLTAKNSAGQTATCSAHISKTSTACSPVCLSDQSCTGGKCVYGVCGDKVCNDCSNAFSPCSINEPVTCPSDCGGITPTSVCGNGIIEAGEECDDGNIKSGDGCSASCKKESAPPPPGGDASI